MRKKFTREEIFKILFERLSIFFPDLPALLKEEIINRCHIVTFKRNQVVLKKGEVCNYCYFIIDGFLKSDHKHLGKVVVDWFMGLGDVIISVKSYLRQIPSMERMIAVKNSICVTLHYDDWIWLKKNYHAFSELNGILFQYYYEQSIEREKWKALSATEMYVNLLNEYPHITNNASLTDIASFLCITKYTLSRIRATL